MKRYESTKKLDNQPEYLVKNPYNYIYIVLAIVFIAFIYILDLTEDSSKPSPSPTVQSKEPGTIEDGPPPETKTANRIKPTHPDATQFFTQIEQDNDGNLILPPEVITTTTNPASPPETLNSAQMTELASVLRSRGWITAIDSAGNLEITPSATNFTNSRDTEDVLIPVGTGLASFRTLLESRGWQVHTNTVNGDVLLIPLSSP